MRFGLPNQTLPKTVSTRTDEAIGRLERIIERREQEGAREREEARRDREGARPALRTLTDGMAILVAVDTPFCIRPPRSATRRLKRHGGIARYQGEPCHGLTISRAGLDESV